MSTGFDEFPLVAIEPRNGKPGLTLHLRRVRGPCSERPSVLLLHGGNTDSDTFLVPNGGLAGYLARGYDVWLLDWRSHPRVVKTLLQGSPLGQSVLAERRLYTLDQVASVDLPLALAEIREQIGPRRQLSVLAHCVSGAALCMAVARGELEDFRLSNLVLNTLGLFCEVPWNGWLKAQNFFLERITSEDQQCRSLDPAQPDHWPSAMATAREHWPAAWVPGSSKFLDTLTFMIGQPFSEERLHSEIRRDGFEQYFGPLHLGLYMHSAQIVRRGYAARFDSPDVIDRTRIAQRGGARACATEDLRINHFLSKNVTLFVAPRNRVWHRDSMDKMYEWMRNAGHQRCEKRVLPGYNLQELLWGQNAATQVYPDVMESLAKPPPD